MYAPDPESAPSIPLFASFRRCLLLFLLLTLSLSVPVSAAARLVRVGVYRNPPKIFLTDDGRLSGILGELLDTIAQREHWTLKAVPCQWTHCLVMLRNGRLDLMPDVAYNQQRAKTMNFGKVPALHSWSALYRNPRSHIMSIRDLKDKKVAVLDGSIQQSYLKNLITSFGIHGTKLVPVENLDQGFKMAATGKVDAAVANNFYGSVEAPLWHLQGTPVMFQPVGLFFAAPPGRDTDLLSAIDGYLSRWEANSGSVYFRVITAWKQATRSRRIPATLWWVLGGLAAMLMLAIAAFLFQRRTVREKVRHLRVSENKLAVILDSIDAFIYIKDTRLRYVYANRKVANFFGVPARQILGRRDNDLFDGKTARARLSSDQQVIDQGQRVSFEEETRSPDGAIERSYLTVKQPLRDDRGDIYGLCSISTDFTDHRQNQEKINHLAFFDPLTNLPNRRLLQDRAQHALDNHARTGLDGALLFIDLDNFKVLNDTRGHAKGDQLLAKVGERLSGLVRRADTLARLGGDEFVLLMENLGKNDADPSRYVDRAAGKILRSFDEPFELGHLSHKISASIGVAMFSDAGNSVEELFKRADMAMYEAKTCGRNRLKFFNHQMQASLAVRVLVEAELRDALDNDHFTLHYQAQVDTEGQLLGAEALVRWQHPTRGVLSPAEFVSVAESSGQITALGNWVFRSACRQQAEWAAKHGLNDLVVAVNVSARQFHQPTFVSDVLRILDETGADPRRIELELTESVLAEDIETLIGRMKSLKAKGIRFALDDFGTGYSSLNYLKRLPLDQLKIDRLFVRDLLTDPNDAVIVQIILSLGVSLGLNVIAEGVETPEQRDRLIAMGCHRLQGYLYGRPVPAAELFPQVVEGAPTKRQ